MKDPNSTRKSCVLCSRNDAKMTVEHILGEWIGNALTAKGETDRTYAVVDPATGEITGDEWREPRPRHQLKRRILCKQCNVVWGGDIHDRASRVLKPLMRGERGVLSSEDASLIALWATMVAVLYEFTDPDSMHVYTAKQRRRFRERAEPPAGTVVQLGTIGIFETGWPRRARHWVAGLPEVVGGPIPEYPTAQITTLGFGAIVLFVYGTTFVGPVNDPSRGRGDWLIRLWPDPYGGLMPLPGHLNTLDINTLSGNDPRVFFPIDPSIDIGPPLPASPKFRT